MKWIGNRQSDNVEDRRGMSTGGKAIMGGGVLGIVIFIKSQAVTETKRLGNGENTNHNETSSSSKPSI